MKTTTNNKQLSKMLGRYSATAIAAMAVGSVASGQIVHSPDVNETIHLGDTLQLDFDGDEYSDVEFSISLNPGVDKYWGNGIWTNAIPTPGGKAVGASWYSGDFINPLELDQVISADTSFTFMNQAKPAALDTATMATGMGLISSMLWTSWGIYGWGVTVEDTTTYLGYEFRIDEEPRYAWVKVTIHRTNEFPGKDNYGGDNLYLVVNEYAYETTGSSILAGAIHPGVGVEDVTKEGFSFYPNPASDMVTVRMQESRQYEVNVFDMTGRNVLNSRFDGMEYTMDVNELTSGMYMLQISNGDLRLNKQLIVK